MIQRECLERIVPRLEIVYKHFVDIITGRPLVLNSLTLPPVN